MKRSKKPASKKPTKKSSVTAKFVEQLSELDDFAFRPMFGCIGLYSRGVFFGIVMGEMLFFRVNSKTLPKYLAKESQPFVFKERQKSNNYYEVPPSVIRNSAELLRWARDAVFYREG